MHPRSFLVGTVTGVSIGQFLQHKHAFEKSKMKHTSIFVQSKEQKPINSSPVSFIIHNTNNYSAAKLKAFDCISSSIYDKFTKK